MKYEGNFDVEVNAKTKLIQFKLNKDGSGKYTADDADAILDAALVYVADNPAEVAGFNRWDFFIPDVNEKLAKATKVLPVSKVKDAVKAGMTPYIGVGKWGKPRMTIASPVDHVKKTVTKSVLL